MKNFLLIFFIAIIFISGCNNETTTNLESLKLKDFSEFGIIHNEFLTNAKSNFQEIEYISSIEEKIEYINHFNKSFIETLNLAESKKQMLKNGLNKNKQLVQTNFLTSKAFHQNQNGRINSEDADLFQTIETLHNDGLISAFGFELLVNFTNDVKGNYDGTLSDSQLKNNILKYITEFESHGYTFDSGEGQMIGNILSISISSIEWWEKNPDAFDYNSENGRIQFAPWAGADLVGAAWGGATGAIGSYAGTGEVNWTAVGIGALSGAIAGSTGAVSKIAKLLF